MYKTLLSLALFAAFNATASVPQGAVPLSLSATLAKHGADDPKGDDRGKHGVGHAKHGADDPKGDDRGKHGAGHA